MISDTHLDGEWGHVNRYPLQIRRDALALSRLVQQLAVGVLEPCDHVLILTGRVTIGKRYEDDGRFSQTGEWAGENFDPENFSPKAANLLLKQTVSKTAKVKLDQVQ